MKMLNWKMLNKIGWVFILLLSLSGCMLGPNFERPEVELYDYFNYDSLRSDTVINLHWWEYIGNKQLEDLILEGLENNKDVQISAARIEEARALLGMTKAEFWPTFGYSGSAGRGNIANGVILDDPVNGFSVGASMQWELDFWGKYRRANQAAKADLLATTYGMRSVQISLISDIASTYILLLDFRNRLNISEQTLETRQHSLNIMTARFNRGIIPKIDLHQAQIQEAIAAANVPLFKRQVAKTEHALQLLVGRLPDSIAITDTLASFFKLPEIPVGIPSDLLERRPDILASEQQLAAQTAQIGVAQAARFPSISLTGMLGLASAELGTIADGQVWSAGVDLLGPIFQFGKNKRRVEAQRYRTEQALHQYEYTVLNAFREVEDALIETHTFGQELEATQRRIEAAEGAARLSNLRYDKGVADYLEVLENERSLFNAKLLASEIMQDHLNSYVRLYKVLGGGWITPDEEAEANAQE